MKPLTTEQIVFLNKVIKSGILDKYTKDEMFPNFNESLNINYLKKQGRYWVFPIISKITKIMNEGTYDFHESKILNSIGRLWESREEIKNTNK